MKRIGVDVGGTFTDLVYVDDEAGVIRVHKLPTTPDDPSRGFVAGIDKALRLAGADAAALRHVLHGTTTATNAILESKGVATALLTTAGFRYVLEIGRHDVPRRANMFAWVKPARPVPPSLSRRTTSPRRSRRDPRRSPAETDAGFGAGRVGDRTAIDAVGSCRVFLCCKDSEGLRGSIIENADSSSRGLCRGRKSNESLHQVPIGSGNQPHSR